MSALDGDPVVLGRIGAPYGVKGWLKVRSYTDPVENLLDYQPWLLRLRGQWQEVEVLQARRHRNSLVAQLAGCESPEQARTYNNADIAVPADEMPVLDQDEYYWHQLEGLQVLTKSGDRELLLGRIDQMIETGANEVMVVCPCEGSIDKRERLIPWLPGQVLIAVEPESDRILVAWDKDF